MEKILNILSKEVWGLYYEVTEMGMVFVLGQFRLIYSDEISVPLSSTGEICI